MHSFLNLLSTFSDDNNERGKQFEILCKWLLETDPVYARKLVKVWLWNEWPERWGPDCGIDLVAEDTEGKIWAIQAKCYNQEYDVTKRDIDSFLSESSNPKIDQRLLIATTDRVSAKANSVIARSNALLPVNKLLLSDLLDKQISWPTSFSSFESGSLVKKYSLRVHQTKAINDVVSGFETSNRGQLIMACGTGKTHTGLWITEALGCDSILILLPSLLLLSKTLNEWLVHSSSTFRFLPVCSDESAGRSAEDTIRFSSSDLSFASTTDCSEIAEFLSRDGKKVVFSTYQSSPQIAEAYARENLKPFDLVICDEAHRCAGKAGSSYTVALHENNVPAVKRLFMTATPRIYASRLKAASEERGVGIFSMDDVETFGPVFHTLTFGEAIERDLLSDYRVVVIGVNDDAYARMIAERELLSTENEITTDAKSLAAHIGLAKAIKNYDLRRVISFHSRVKSASEFSTEFPKVLDWITDEERPSGLIDINHVSGYMSTDFRNIQLKKLANLSDQQRMILSNARCLSEGVDVPALDGVAFIDPKSSEIDIVQAVGRAIRKSSDKVIGTIVIPVFIDDKDLVEEAFDKSQFKSVWSVINALRAHDDVLGEELDSFRYALGRTGQCGIPEKIHFDLPTTVTVEFEQALSTQLVEATSNSWEFWYGLAETFVEEHGHLHVSRQFLAQGKFRLGWWLGTQKRAYRQGQLSQERINRLEELGLIWNFAEHQWELAFSKLKDYQGKFNSANAPKSFKTDDGFSLGIWCQTQRKERRKGRLSDGQISRLDDLGFIWDPVDKSWNDGFEALKAYKLEFGHTNPSMLHVTPEGYTLGRWVRSQRNAYKGYRNQKLPADRIHALESLGFDWDLLASQWEEGFNSLKAYIEEHDTFYVPVRFETSKGFKLWLWENAQRTNYKLGKLSEERIGRLEAIGFVWDLKTNNWEEGFQQLCKFKDKFGHIDVPHRYVSDEGFKLGPWFAYQKNAVKNRRIEESLVQRLRSLGDLDTQLDKQWEKGFRQLEIYKETYGNVSPNQKYRAPNGHRLGAWCYNQKLRYQEGKLSSDRQERLLSLGFSLTITPRKKKN